MNSDKIIKNHIAEMLRNLVIEHKKNCNSENCNISTFLIYQEFYSPFLGGEEAEKNLKDFI